MFYKVGEWKNYYFIYDSFDNSCELIDKNMLDESGIHTDVFEKSADNINKLILLCHLNWKHENMQIPLVSYKLCMSDSTMRNEFVFEFTLSLILVDLESFYGSKDKDFVFNMYKRYAYCPDWALVLAVGVEHMTTIKRDVSYINDFRLYADMFRGLSFSLCDAMGNWINTIDGMIIPSSMFVYLYNLALSHNINGILCALNGGLDKDIKVTSDIQRLCLRNISSHVKDVSWKV